MGGILTFCIVASLSLPGCLFTPPPPSDSLQPLKITYINIGETQYNFIGQLALTYTGTIEFPYCMDNEGSEFENGFEVYQNIRTGAQPNLRLVHKYDSGPRYYPINMVSAIKFQGSHHVYWNETIEGEGSTNYVIHIWNQILDPEPMHRQDRWFNMTFIPYQSSTTYTEGKLTDDGQCPTEFERD